MELLLIWRLIKRRWWLMLIPVVIVSFVAIPALLANEQGTTGRYQASFLYSAAQEQSNLPDRDGDYQDVWLASEFVVNAFTDWVKSSTFRQELASRVGDGVDLAPLTIASDNDRSIGIVIMQHNNADALLTIANAAIDVLQTRNQAYFPHLGDQPAEVTILDAPVPVFVNPPVADRFEPILQLGLAVLAGLLIGIVVEYLDPTLRTRDEVERQGLMVLAAIPRHK